MHELPVVQDIIRTMDEESERNGLKKIDSVELVIGELSSVVGECVKMYFDTLSEGHTCENAKLNFTHTHAELRCMNCGNVFEHNSSFSCPLCGGDGKLVKGTGRDFYIKSFNGR